MIFSKAYPEPPWCEAEVLRYAGCRQADPDILSLLAACRAEVRDCLTYKVCYCESAVTIDGDACRFDGFTCRSHALARHLAECDRVVLFAATVGVGIDRLIAKHGKLSPTKALLLQAIGAERIEALCDVFCDELAHTYGGVTSRFSPGYGDLPLESQTELFRVLDCERKIGLTLNDSLLMSPSKSVTAMVGLGGSRPPHRHSCEACSLTNCAFRGAL